MSKSAIQVRQPPVPLARNLGAENIEASPDLYFRHSQRQGRQRLRSLKAELAFVHAAVA